MLTAASGFDASLDQISQNTRREVKTMHWPYRPPDDLAISCSGNNGSASLRYARTVTPSPSLSAPWRLSTI